MANFMTHKFTTREKVLLIVLVVILLIGLYFLLVFYPVKRDRERIAAEKEEIESRIEVQQIVTRLYDDMQEQLKTMDKSTYMPEYDNIEQLTFKLNTIFADVKERLNYSESEQDGIVSRVIAFSFEATGYDQAKTILTSLTTTEYRSLLNSLNITPKSGNVETDVLTISGTITFYELKK